MVWKDFTFNFLYTKLETKVNLMLWLCSRDDVFENLFKLYFLILFDLSIE